MTETTEIDSSVPIFIPLKPLIELYAVRRAHFPIFVKYENWKYEKRQNYARGWGGGGGGARFDDFFAEGVGDKCWPFVTGRVARGLLECQMAVSEKWHSILELCHVVIHSQMEDIVNIGIECTKSCCGNIAWLRPIRSNRNFACWEVDVCLEGRWTSSAPWHSSQQSWHPTVQPNLDLDQGNSQGFSWYPPRIHQLLYILVCLGTAPFLSTVGAYFL